MTEHTPGPWHVVGPPWGDGMWVIAGNTDPHIGRFICDCEEIDPEVYDDERNYFADARLIAATPELLEELKKASEMLRQMEVSEREYGHHYTAAACGRRKDAANEIIAKAEGR